MRTSTKFPVAVHALMMIATATAVKQKINSDDIAKSTGVNAVNIRTIFKALKEANMISVSPGPGGVTLAKSADSITLWDVFTSVETMDTEGIFKLHQNPSDDCIFGHNIYGLLKAHFTQAVSAAQRELSSVTIAMLLEELRAVAPQMPSLKEVDEPQND